MGEPEEKKNLSFIGLVYTGIGSLIHSPCFCLSFDVNKFCVVDVNNFYKYGQRINFDLNDISWWKNDFQNRNTGCIVPWGTKKKVRLTSGQVVEPEFEAVMVYTGSKPRTTKWDRVKVGNEKEIEEKVNLVIEGLLVDEPRGPLHLCLKFDDEVLCILNSKNMYRSGKCCKREASGTTLCSMWMKYFQGRNTAILREWKGKKPVKLSSGKIVLPELEVAMVFTGKRPKKKMIDKIVKAKKSEERKLMHKGIMAEVTKWVSAKNYGFADLIATDDEDSILALNVGTKVALFRDKGLQVGQVLNIDITSFDRNGMEGFDILEDVKWVATRLEETSLEIPPEPPVPDDPSVNVTQIFNCRVGGIKRVVGLNETPTEAVMVKGSRALGILKRESMFIFGLNMAKGNLVDFMKANDTWTLELESQNDTMPVFRRGWIGPEPNGDGSDINVPGNERELAVFLYERGLSLEMLIDIAKGLWAPKIFSPLQDTPRIYVGEAVVSSIYKNCGLFRMKDDQRHVAFDQVGLYVHGVRLTGLDLSLVLLIENEKSSFKIETSKMLESEKSLWKQRLSIEDDDDLPLNVTSYAYCGERPKEPTDKIPSLGEIKENESLMKWIGQRGITPEFFNDVISGNVLARPQKGGSILEGQLSEIKRVNDPNESPDKVIMRVGNSKGILSRESMFVFGRKMDKADFIQYLKPSDVWNIEFDPDGAVEGNLPVYKSGWIGPEPSGDGTEFNVPCGSHNVDENLSAYLKERNLTLDQFEKIVKGDSFSKPFFPIHNYPMEARVRAKVATLVNDGSMETTFGSLIINQNQRFPNKSVAFDIRTCYLFGVRMNRFILEKMSSVSLGATFPRHLNVDITKMLDDEKSLWRQRLNLASDDDLPVFVSNLSWVGLRPEEPQSRNPTLGEIKKNILLLKMLSQANITAETFLTSYSSPASYSGDKHVVKAQLSEVKRVIRSKTRKSPADVIMKVGDDRGILNRKDMFVFGMNMEKVDFIHYLKPDDVWNIETDPSNKSERNLTVYKRGWIGPEPLGDGKKINVPLDDPDYLLYLKERSLTHDSFLKIASGKGSGKTPFYPLHNCPSEMAVEGVVAKLFSHEAGISNGIFQTERGQVAFDLSSIYFYGIRFSGSDLTKVVGLNDRFNLEISEILEDEKPAWERQLKVESPKDLPHFVANLVWIGLRPKRPPLEIPTLEIIEGNQDLSKWLETKNLPAKDFRMLLHGFEGLGIFNKSNQGNAASASMFPAPCRPCHNFFGSQEPTHQFFQSRQHGPFAHQDLSPPKETSRVQETMRRAEGIMGIVMKCVTPEDPKVETILRDEKDYRLAKFMAKTLTNALKSYESESESKSFSLCWQENRKRSSSPDFPASKRRRGEQEITDYNYYKSNNQ